MISVDPGTHSENGKHCVNSCLRCWRRQWGWLGHQIGIPTGLAMQVREMGGFWSQCFIEILRSHGEHIIISPILVMVFCSIISGGAWLCPPGCPPFFVRNGALLASWAPLVISMAVRVWFQGVICFHCNPCTMRWLTSLKIFVASRVSSYISF